LVYEPVFGLRNWLAAPSHVSDANAHFQTGRMVWQAWGKTSVCQGRTRHGSDYRNAVSGEHRRPSFYIRKLEAAAPKPKWCRFQIPWLVLLFFYAIGELCKRHLGLQHFEQQFERAIR